MPSCPLCTPASTQAPRARQPNGGLRWTGGEIGDGTGSGPGRAREVDWRWTGDGTGGRIDDERHARGKFRGNDHGETMRTHQHNATCK